MWSRTDVKDAAATIDFTGFKQLLSTEKKAPISTSGKVTKNQ